MVVVYFSANAYLIDTFGSCVASALAAKTVIRSGLGAAMPLFMVRHLLAILGRKFSLCVTVISDAGSVNGVIIGFGATIS